MRMRWIEELRPKFARLPGLRVFLQNPPPIQIGGQQSRSAYQFTLRGSDTAELYASAQSFEARLRELASLRDVTSDLQIRTPR